jgi:hypothetical protein
MWKPAVVLRNRAPRARGGVVELELSATLATSPSVRGRRHARARRVASRRGASPACRSRLLSRRERIALTESPRDYPMRTA